MTDTKRSAYVTHAVLWSTATFISVAILTLMGYAFSWHKEKPHDGALQEVHLVGLEKDTQHLKEEAAYQREKMDVIDGKVDLLLAR